MGFFYRITIFSLEKKGKDPICLDWVFVGFGGLDLLSYVHIDAVLEIDFLGADKGVFIW